MFFDYYINYFLNINEQRDKKIKHIVQYQILLFIYH